MQEPASVTSNTPIQLKGTRQGLLLVIREDAEVAQVMELVAQRFCSDASFLTGASLFLDLGWREANDAFFEALEEVFRANSVVLAGVLSTSNSAREVAEKRGHKAIIGRLGLSKHQGRKSLKDKISAPSPASPENGTLTQEADAPEIIVSPPINTRATAMALFLENTLTVSPPVPEAGLPDAMFSPEVKPVVEQPEPAPPELCSEDRESEATLYIRRTLRSGARAMYPGNIVVMGDVNPGAELEAEGDIVVIGSLRGKAHAGSAGNPRAQVWALSLSPIQLRIGECVWHDEKAKPKNRNDIRLQGPQKAIIKDEKVCIVSAT